MMHDIGVSSLSTPHSAFMTTYSKVALSSSGEDNSEFDPMTPEMSAVEGGPSEQTVIVAQRVFDYIVCPLLANGGRRVRYVHS